MGGTLIGVLVECLGQGEHATRRPASKAMVTGPSGLFSCLPPFDKGESLLRIGGSRWLAYASGGSGRGFTGAAADFPTCFIAGKQPSKAFSSF